MAGGSCTATAIIAMSLAQLSDTLVIFSEASCTSRGTRRFGVRFAEAAINVFEEHWAQRRHDSGVCVCVVEESGPVVSRERRGGQAEWTLGP